MALDRTYYFDFETDHYWYRWAFVPNNIVSYTEALAPEWGADPDIVGGSTYRKIPPLIIKEAERAGESTYDKIAIGLPTRSGYRVRVNLSELYKYNTDTDLNDLRVYLKITNSLTATLVATPGAPTFNLGHQWTLLRGNKGDDIDDFVVEFHGIQIPSKEREWDIKSGDRVEVELEVVDIGEYLLKTAKTEWVCDRFNDAGTTETAPRIWLKVWRAGGPFGIYGWYARPRSSATAFDLKIGLWYSFYADMNVVLNEMYQNLTRQTVTTANHDFALRSSQSTAWPSSDHAGMPSDVAQFKQQSNGADGSASASYVSRTSLGFLARVESSGGSILAGVCSDGDGSIHGYDSLWHYLNDECWGNVARGKYKVVSRTSLELWFYAAGEGNETHDLSRSDILEFKVSQGKASLSEVKVDRPLAEQLDYNPIVVDGDPNAGTKVGWSMAFENIPSNGTDDDFDGATSAAVKAVWPTFGVMAAHGWPNLIFRTYVYKQSASDYSSDGVGDIWIAAHHDARLFHTYSSSYTDYTYALPADLPTPTILISDADIAEFVYLTKGVIIEIQRNAGMAVWAAKYIRDNFGNVDAALYEMKVRSATADHRALGDRIRIVPSNGGVFSARPLLANGSDDSVDDVPGIGHIVSITPERGVTSLKVHAGETS